MGLWHYASIGVLASTLVACGGDDAKGGSGGTTSTGGTSTGGTGTGATGGTGTGGTSTGGTGGATGGSPGKACTLPNRDLWTWDLSVMPPPDVQVNAKCVTES